MAFFTIHGGTPLRGEVTLSGAKNLASKLLIATLLTPDECVIENVPDIGENQIALEILRLVGATPSREIETIRTAADRITNSDVRAAPRNRLSGLTIGPLLFRTGRAAVPFPGGDRIGRRPVDFHLDALRSLGATITEESDGFSIEAPNGLQGAQIDLPFPSVGATETTLLTAAWARGETLLQNAAIEPEVLELVRFLQAMGAKIEQLADRTFRIQGVTNFSRARQRVIADRLEAVSYASAALATRGDVLLHEAVVEHLDTYITFVRRIGGGVAVESDGIRFYAEGHLRATDIRTDVYPGFVTDWQQPSTVVLVTAGGTSTIHETVYENRFGYVRELNRMGASIDVQTACLQPACRYDGQNFEHVAVIQGPSHLHGTDIEVPDIRAGMAHVVAALVADGVSRLNGIEHLDRGYGHQFEAKLRGIGASIERGE